MVVPVDEYSYDGEYYNDAREGHRNTDPRWKRFFFWTSCPIKSTFRCIRWSRGASPWPVYVSLFPVRVKQIVSDLPPVLLMAL